MYPRKKFETLEHTRPYRPYQKYCSMTHCIKCNLPLNANRQLRLNRTSRSTDTQFVPHFKLRNFVSGPFVPSVYDLILHNLFPASYCGPIRDHPTILRYLLHNLTVFPTSQRKKCPIPNTSPLLLLRKIIAFYSVDYMQHINTHYGQNSVFKS